MKNNINGRISRSAAPRIGLWSSRGAWLGALAAVATALSDYGAIWLWLPLWRDRGWLLARILATQAPCGALLGCLLGAVLGIADPGLERLGRYLSAGNAAAGLRWPPRLNASLLTLLVSPAVVRVAALLFTGGKMSRLSPRILLQAAAAVILLCCTWLAIYFFYRVLDYCRQAAPRAAWSSVLGLFALVFVVGKLDQRILPNQYLYLHGVATVFCWAVSVLALAAAAGKIPSARRLEARFAYAGLAVPPILIAVLLFNLSTINANQNVLVSLIDPRASHSRWLIQCVEPLINGNQASNQAMQAYQEARRRRTLRERHVSTADLPVLPEANVLLVTIDALRADHMSAYGYRRRTSPNLDRFADASVLFEHAYTQVPHSSFSVSSFMTSEYLHETVELGQPLPEATLATTLAGAGYHTAAFFTGGIFYTEGVRLKEYENNAFGFALNDQAARDAEAATDRALEEIDRIVASGERKSFLWVHYFDTHEPYRAATFGNSDVDRYDSEIQRVDRAAARLIAEAQRRFKRDLIVVLSADHGEEFYEHGGVYHGSTLYEEQVHVPLIIHAPGLAPRRIKTPVELIDVAPTLLALLQIPVPSSMRGDDLRALAVSKASEPGPVFSAVIHKRMAVAWPYKLIADLRFGLYELYDLENDPYERHNLADQKPSLVQSLRGEVYAWLDSLSVRAPEQNPSTLAAINRGRLGDRRAVASLCAILLDPAVSTDMRVEAARILGRLADTTAADSLARAIRDQSARVAAESSVALGRMYDQRARASLRRLVMSEDPDLRSRAAVSLARLRDREAVPGLIDALWIAPNDYERDEAIRWLGRLRDSRALEPLLNLLPDLRTRYLVVLSMGQIGDRRAYDALADLLTWEKHSNVRDNAIRGLGLLRDPRAVKLIVPLAVADPSMKNAPESLVRLGAIEKQAIGGSDGRQNQARLRGFGRCYVGSEMHDWDYLHRTWCETAQSSARMTVSVPGAVSSSSYGAVAVLEIKRTDAAKPADLRLSIGSIQLEPVQVDDDWSEYRWQLKPGQLPLGSADVEISTSSGGARFAVDHLLLLPQNTEPQPRFGG